MKSVLTLDKRDMPSMEINTCKSILRNLFSKRYKNLAWIFYEPVDADLLGLYDYHHIVKEPMDLSTVKHRLNSNFYSNAIDFARDMRLIFYNAYMYTNPGHLCYDMAKKLQTVFEDMYAKVPLPANCSNNNNECSDSSSELDVEKPSSCNSSPAQPKVSVIMDSTQMRHESMDIYDDWKELDLPMTTEEDLELQIRVQQLSGVMLLNVIHMIHQMEGLNFKYPNKELEFDVRSLKTHTKRSIMIFLASNGINGKRICRLKRSHQ